VAEFENEELCATYLAKRLRQAGVEAAISNELANAVVDGLRDPWARAAGDFERGEQMLVSSLGWVVRDDDVKLLEGFFAAASAAAGANFFFGSATAAAIVGMVAAVFKTVNNLRRKGAFLDPIKCQILFVTRQSENGLELPEIVEKVQALPGCADLTTADVKSDLETMTSVRLRDGSVQALVACASDGRWSTCGI
jgi:hypothetical protein